MGVDSSDVGARASRLLADLKVTYLTVDDKAGINGFISFSSRRRHTPFSRDWSSDVCSSDLPPQAKQAGRNQALPPGRRTAHLTQQRGGTSLTAHSCTKPASAALAWCGGQVTPERHPMTGSGTPMGNRATGPMVD